MLTGRETVPATFAATAHLHRAAAAALEVLPAGGVVTTVWGALVTEVRHAALALADDGGGPGLLVALDRTAPRAKRAVTVLVASVVGAEVVAGSSGDGAGEQLDLPALAAAGSGIDDRAPGRYEELVGRRSPADPLLRDGATVHTSGTLLVAARSLAQAAGIGLEDRLAVDLAVGSVTEIVAGLLVPCLTGAATWVAVDGVAPGDVPVGQRPTFVASAATTPASGATTPSSGATLGPASATAPTAGTSPPPGYDTAGTTPTAGTSPPPGSATAVTATAATATSTPAPGSTTPAPGSTTPSLGSATAAGSLAAANAATGRRRVRRRDRPTEVRTVVVGGDGGGPITGAGVTGLAVAAAGGIVTGFGPPGTLGRPLPGASIAIDDDGSVLVRAASVAPGAPGLREDGWLTTGLSGTLEDGHLVVDGTGPPDPS